MSRSKPGSTSSRTESRRSRSRARASSPAPSAHAAASVPACAASARCPRCRRSSGSSACSIRGQAAQKVRLAVAAGQCVQLGLGCSGRQRARRQRLEAPVPRDLPAGGGQRAVRFQPADDDDRRRGVGRIAARRERHRGRKRDQPGGPPTGSMLRSCWRRPVGHGSSPSTVVWRAGRQATFSLTGRNDDDVRE